MNQVPKARPVLGEVLFTFLAATVAIAIAYRFRAVPFFERYLSVLAAVVFLYLPAGRIFRRGEELDAYGFTLKGWPRGLALYGLCALIVFPLFIFGYWVYLHRFCPHLPRILGYCAPTPYPALRLPPEPLLMALGQVLVVALPEEFFFRGYVQGRLATIWPLPQTLLISSALFALAHFLVSLEPATFAVFFPGLLFGLLRAYSPSILAGTLFHASCNFLIDTLHRSLG